MDRPLTLLKLDLDWTIAAVERELERARARCDRLVTELVQLHNRYEQVQGQLDAKRVAGLGGTA